MATTKTSRAMDHEKIFLSGSKVREMLIKGESLPEEFTRPEVEAVLKAAREVYKNRKIICVFQPHRYSRVKYLRNEFSLAFKLSDQVLLCPIYKAGENLKLNFSYNSFAKLIIKNSKVNLIIIQNEKELSKYIKQSAYGGKIYIGMGDGTITNWVRNLKNILK